MSELRWTEEQTRAIISAGDVLLAANAGTGKTTTIVGKILWQLGLDVGERESGGPVPRCLDPCSLEAIAAITFTEKGAYDLKAKLRSAIERSERAEELRWEIDRASVGTIHGFCAELLRDHALRLRIDPTFRVLDERETRVRQDELIRDVIYEALESREPGAVDLVRRFRLYGWGRGSSAIAHVRGVLREIRWRTRTYDRWAAGGELDPDRIRRIASEAGLSQLAGNGAADASIDVAASLYRFAFRALREWLSWLEEENVRDFDSLILDARRLLTRTGADTRPALESIRRRYRLLIIDEFQDTDAAQRDIAFAIAGSESGDAAEGLERPQLFLVGDPKQSIYRFRGADITVWNAVQEAIGDSGQRLDLTHNFRSEPRVIDFVNLVGGGALGECAERIAGESPESRVDYSPLVAAGAPTAAAGVEWLAVDGPTRMDDRRELEGRLVASRIRRLVSAARVRDPETGELRPCTFRDIAILARTRHSLNAIETGLRQYAVPLFNTATGGLAGRLEVLDLVTFLRVVDNPHDDVHAFAFLRSPFVGLRDEVLARLRLDPATGTTSYLGQAERYLEGVDRDDLEWFPAPESPEVAEVEREALRRGLTLVRDAQRLVDRAETAELLETVLRETGYRMYLLLREEAAEALANIERFVALAEQYRHLPLGAFLALWDRWGEEDLGVPQAPLFSKEDDAVTLSTIHTAKGLEWPIVFLIGTEGGPDTGRRLTNSYWSDARFGPVFMPKQEERGPRAARLFERELLEDHAEEARLLYVAMTRARDRLIVSGPTEKPKGYAAWLAVALDDAVEEHEAPEPTTSSETSALTSGESDSGARPGDGGATGADPATGTGGQIDAFGVDHDREDPGGQFSLFTRPAENHDPTASADLHDDPSIVGKIEPVAGPVVLFRTPSPIQARFADAPITLAWLAGIEPGEAPALVRRIRPRALRAATSATEQMTRERDPEEWAMRYRHGVQPIWRFSPEPRSEGELPPHVRGTLIHGVLERIEEIEELDRILSLTIAGIEAPELELLEPGSRYRDALAAEIAAVVRSDEWRWYTEDKHYRELRFVHLVDRRDWRIGAFDLYRPAAAGESGRARDSWIIDFKTHRISAPEAARVAREYQVQARIYREAAGAILAPMEEGIAPPREGEGAGSTDVRVAFHFTHPNVAVQG